MKGQVNGGVRDCLGHTGQGVTTDNVTETDTTRSDTTSPFACVYCGRPFHE